MGRGEGVYMSFWLCDVDGTTCGDDAGCALSKGEGVLLLFWLCDVDAQPVVMMLAVRSSVIIKTLLLIMKLLISICM